MRFRWYWVLASVFLLCAVFSFYLYESYRQLDGAFGQNEQFVPTRIYSDVTRIAAPQTRRFVQSRLQALAYKIHPGAKGSEDVLSFTLNPIEYPAYLLPDGHPTAEAGGKRITLKFSGPGNDAMIQNVLIADAEVNEIFLEPELVATMARGEREIRRVLKFDEIPVLIKKAIIAVEDQHFLEHSGLDPRGLFRALWVNLRTGSLAQGGSTITAQLVKNLLARRDKNILRKLNELVLSLLLEARYSKELILERYLNEVYLGQVGSLEVHGVAEGAQYFFGKQLKELNLGEVALMAGLIRGPGFYSPYRYRARAVERQRHVLKKMVRQV
jgi:penicillin-binding protein 1B